MGRRSKKDRLQSIVVIVLADNVRRMRDGKYEKLRTDKQRNVALASAADTSPSQIQRILAREVAAGIDLVERLANVFQVRPQDMLTPYFGAGTSAAYPEPPPLDRPRPGQAVHESPTPPR